MTPRPDIGRLIIAFLALMGAASGWGLPAFAQVDPSSDKGLACYPTQFPIARFGEVVLDRPQTLLGETTPFGKAEPMGNFAAGDPLRVIADPVGRLDLVMSNGCMVTCTATLLADGLIITARHCLRPTSMRVIKAHLVFDHYTSVDSGKPTIDVDLESVQTFDPVKDANGIATNPDIAVARLTSTPDRPTAILYPNLPGDDSSMEIIHHPDGAPKYITRGFCRSVSNNGVVITHRCDTVGGSSGAPMIDQATGQIIGIHTNGRTNSGDVDANRGFAIGAIAPQLRAAYGEAFFATPTQAVTAASISQALVKPVVEAPLQTPTMAGSELAAAISKYDAGRFADALGPLLTLAGAGNSVAQVYLGDMYAKGLEVTRNEGRAFDYYLKAALQGDAMAKLRIGNAYMNGLGVPQDLSSAVRWYALAVEAGNADAKYNLALMYLSGKGVEYDYKLGLDTMRSSAATDHHDAIIYLAFNLQIDGQSAEGIKILTRAVELDDSYATVRLGQLYLVGGKAISRDFDKARLLFQKGADLGERDAVHNIALMYRDGIGVARDSMRAERLLRQAVAMPERESRSGDVAWRLGDEIAIDLAEVADRNGVADRTEVFDLYRKALGNLLPEVRGRALIGLAKLHVNGDGTPIDKNAALYYSVLGLDAILESANEQDLTQAWTVFKRSRDSLTLEDQKSELIRVCDADVHYHSVPHILSKCDGGEPHWTEIAKSSSVPTLTR